jgi:hypothetical protein
MPFASHSSNLYDPSTVDISRLADLIMRLKPEQREALEIRLSREDMEQLEDSAEDLKSGDTVSIDEW